MGTGGAPFWRTALASCEPELLPRSRLPEELGPARRIHPRPTEAGPGKFLTAQTPATVRAETKGTIATMVTRAILTVTAIRATSARGANFNADAHGRRPGELFPKVPTVAWKP